MYVYMHRYVLYIQKYTYVLSRFPGEVNGNPCSVFLPGEFHGQRSLAGCSP